MNTPHRPWNPDSHAALYDAARRQAAALRRDAIAAFWRGLAQWLRCALQRRGARAPQQPAAC